MDQPVNGGSTVDTMYRAGRLARQAKKFDEAKPLLVGAHAAWAVELGEEHEKTLAAANDLALLLKDTGRVAEAEQLYRATYDARKKKLGEDHPHTLDSASDLAAVLKGTDRVEEAETLLRGKYDAQKKKLGEDHPDTLNSANDLAKVLRDMDRAEEAEELLRTTYDFQKKIGNNYGYNRALWTTATNLADLLKDTGRAQEAETLYRLTYDALVKNQGRNHPDTQASANHLAVVLEMMGRKGEAEAWRSGAITGGEGPECGPGSSEHRRALMAAAPAPQMRTGDLRRRQGTGGDSTMMLQYPHDAMGLIIGKGGRRIADIQKISGAQVEFHNQTPGSTWRQVEVTGTPAAIAAAKELLDQTAVGENAGDFIAAYPPGFRRQVPSAYPFERRRDSRSPESRRGRSRSFETQPRDSRSPESRRGRGGSPSESRRGGSRSPPRRSQDDSRSPAGWRDKMYHEPLPRPPRVEGSDSGNLDAKPTTGGTWGDKLAAKQDQVKEWQRSVGDARDGHAPPGPRKEARSFRPGDERRHEELPGGGWRCGLCGNVNRMLQRRCNMRSCAAPRDAGGGAPVAKVRTPQTNEVEHIDGLPKAPPPPPGYYRAQIEETKQAALAKDASRKRQAEDAPFDDERKAARGAPQASFAPPPFAGRAEGDDMRRKRGSDAEYLPRRIDRSDPGEVRAWNARANWTGQERGVGYDSQPWIRDRFDERRHEEAKGFRPPCRYGDKCAFEHTVVGGDGRRGWDAMGGDRAQRQGMPPPPPPYRRGSTERDTDRGRGHAAARAANPARLSEKNLASLRGEPRAPRDGDLASEASHFTARWLPKDLLGGNDIHTSFHAPRRPRDADTVSEASHFTERWLPRDLI